MEKRALQEKFMIGKVVAAQSGLSALFIAVLNRGAYLLFLLIQNKLVKLVEDAQKSVEVVLTAEKEAREVLNLDSFVCSNE